LFARGEHLIRKICLLLLALLVTPTVLLQSKTQPLNNDQAGQEASNFLKDLVRIDTQDPPGNESLVAQYLATVLRREGINVEVLEPVPGRASVVARLKGDGSRRPILLMAHEDTVPVDRVHWTVDPFAAVQLGDVLYGRGTLDDKGMIAANLEVMLQLKRSNTPLARDVIFLAEASEERGSEAGMQTIVNKYWDKIACEYALNEGGYSLVEKDEVKYIGVATGEKLPRKAILAATGTSGHGSVPIGDNAVIHLADAVSKVGKWDSPVRLNETTREFFDRLSVNASPDEATMYRNLSDPVVQQELRTKKPQYYSMLVSSVVPTMLRAGLKENVIPPTAEATLDVRVLPDENLPKFWQELTAVIGDPAVKIVPIDDSFAMPSAPASSVKSEMFAALEKAQKAVAHNAITVPVMTTGATDSSFLRAKGVQAYGIKAPRTDAENRTEHGNDERVELRYLGMFVQYIYAAVTEVAARH
jgi:acetylornithine deacetylase/succinyl-diaminopimelate desuccinylase-like protein